MSNYRFAMPRASLLAVAVAMALLPAFPARAANRGAEPQSSGEPRSGDGETTTFGTIRVRGPQPTSLPARIPTTMEGITGAEIRDRINATDAEDALKYFPSLLVRKRYIGDYDHAVLATRASGTGNSARSLVYADGILLSNLLGNGASFTPRWGLVAPEEIERVDVLYGPFSAAYSGNSAGAVVDYVTRMPERFEAHLKYGHYRERFRLYGTEAVYPARSTSASLGNRWGGFSAWVSLNRLDSDAHPIAFATLPESAGTTGGGTAVDGAVAGSNPRNQPWWLVGASGQTHTVQDQAKLKLAYDFTPELRLSYVFGLWKNEVLRDSQAYLRDAAGRPVHAGHVLIDGRRYTLAPTAISLQRAGQEQRMHGLTLRRSGGGWDYLLAWSRFDYAKDLLRSPLLARPAADTGGAGRIADGHGTGWTTANARATWQPDPSHTLEFGLQDDRFELRSTVFDTSDWIRGIPRTRYSAFAGTTGLRSAFVQDTWRWSSRWTGTFGLRAEHWTARDGRIANAVSELGFPRRRENALSPKAAVEFAPSPVWSLKASIGRAVRFPTVSELYQGSIATNVIVNNDPDLAPERSVTSELSWVRRLEHGRFRATLFHERTRDALYSQTNVTVTPNVTSIQNVDAIRTSGAELATELTGIGLDDLDLAASLTFADSVIRENRNFPASEGKWQPRVPRWRANLLATWHPGDRWSFTGGLRYSGRQFNTQDNADLHGDAYTGTSRFLVADARVRYRHDAHWSGALGVDNLANRTYWNFHPYNQRTWSAELRYDY
ncbi:TonB-dependent receptor [Pseudoxanthomonas helianthi]|uniref:TonB-dependent receptor n=1 Tax=Pseudoxanthomonas helianthi TaxID=1453541 RepID=A0A941AUJ7_9GAMM|nr:TonB-dependent receptor [Pseudoxanthomonas helianthi]MBP3985214.1 TonB-dependent receptor [Pseudoxanthomonas helianthi]